MKYRLEVSQPNKMFVVRGKMIRTPFIIDNVNEEDLKLYKAKINLEGIPESKYSIIPMDEVDLQDENGEEGKIKHTNISEDEDEDEPIIQNINSDDSTLDSYLED